MQCRDAAEWLSVLVDGEWQGNPRGYAAAWLHWAGCPRCRSGRAQLQRQRQLCRGLGHAPAPSELRARVLESLADLPVPTPANPSPWQRRRLAAGMAAGLSVALVGGALLESRGSRVLASEVGASIGRAESWHFAGWRMEDGRKVSCEVWGRRNPYLYREQCGDELLVDNGETRLQTFRRGNGKILAVRMPSRRSPEGARWSQLMVDRNWRRQELWQETRDQAVFRSTDAGMQGPGSVAHDYFFVDRRSRLPRRWEYRHVGDGGEEVVAELSAEYNVAVPASASEAVPPPTAELLDVSSGAAPVPSGTYTQSRNGVTVELLPVKVAPDGTVLARLRGWFGSARMDLPGTALFSTVTYPAWARAVEGKPFPWPVLDDRRRPYVLEQDLRNGSGLWGELLEGDHLLYLAPLQPPAAGAPLPRRMQLSLNVLAQAQAARRTHRLTSEEFTWSVELPSRAVPIREEDYMVPPGERRSEYKEDVPLAARVARTRAGMYESCSDWDGAVRWYRAAIALLKPNSDFAQFLRSSLAHTHHQAGDREGQVQVLREILETERRHPETWDHYARTARAQLAELRASPQAQP